MKQILLIVFFVAAFCLVVEAGDHDESQDSLTRHTRVVKHKHTKEVTVSDSNEGLIKGIAGAVRDFGDNVGKGFMSQMAPGELEDILNGIGVILNVAVNTTDSIIDDADDAAGDIARDYYQIAKNYVGKGDDNPKSGVINGAVNVVHDAVDGALHILDSVFNA